MVKTARKNQWSPIFTSLPIILDCKKWPRTNEQLLNFADDKIEALKIHLMSFLEENSCENNVHNV